ADVGVERDSLPLRIGLVFGVVELALLAERRPGGLVPADHQLLLAARDPVPELDPVADYAGHLIGAAAGPARLLAPGPDELAHRLIVGDIRIRGSVLEAEQVAAGAALAAGRGQKALDLPARSQDAAGRAREVA